MRSAAAKITLWPLVTAVAAVGLTGAPSPVSAARQSIEVRVRLKKNQKKIDISGFALQITPPTGFLSISSPVVKIKSLSKARIARESQGTWLVQVEGEPLRKIQADQLWVKGQMLKVGAEPVPYSLEIIENEKAGVDVIARLDLESYLLGVLPSEMPAVWPLEALKAQVVAARSFVLRNAYERRSHTFDVDSTVIDQVYKFLHAAQNHPEWKLKVQRAVRETRGEVLLDPRHRILKAFYSADCGCTTEDPKYVWGKKLAAFESVKDPSCKTRPTTKWHASYSRQSVKKSLFTELKMDQNSKFKTLQVSGRTPSGRVASVVASLEVNGKAQISSLNSQAFRRVFGFHRIRSTDFTLQWMGDVLEVRGQGVGHGVGMCQTGARSMAEDGRTYHEILKLYYPKAQLWTIKHT